MAILTTIMTMFGGQVIDKIWSGFMTIVSQYQQKQLSEIEAKKALLTMLTGAFRDIEVSHSETLAKTYESFQVTLRGSPLLQAAWVALFLSQMLVLVWHQVGIPALCYTVGHNDCYPSSGDTVKWSYLLLGFMLGAGPIVFRSGPGAGESGGFLDRIKNLIK